MSGFRIQDSGFSKRTFIFLLCAVCGICGSAWAVKPPVIFTTSLAAGQNAVAYSAQVKAKFGTKPYSWSIVSGSLPTGLSIAAATGFITGTPTVNNTFAFTVRVTDSEGPAKTDDQGLFITITGSAPAPTPAVSISTTSLPSGQVSAAYTTTLQATGGTSPYTWSIPASCVVPSCGLPPGIALTGATGVTAGTPTASGTYSVTFTVTDSSSPAQTYSKAFAISIAAAPGAAIFSDALTSFAAWSEVNNATDTTIAACPGGGNCAQFHYVICGDSTNSACGASAQDVNRWVRKVFDSTNGFTDGLQHFFIRGYFRLKTPEISEPLLGRKLFYFRAKVDPLYNGNWSVIISHGGNNQGKINVTTQGSGLGLPTLVYYDKGPVIAFDTWYSLEIEISANTPGVSDGIIRVWEGGVLIFENTALNLRANSALGIWELFVGEQVQRFNYAPIDEYRYWKNIVISATGPIGP